DRLAFDTETTLALASRMAVDAISQMTRRQLRVLGFLNVIHHLRPEGIVEADTNEKYYDLMAPFLQIHLAPYMALEFHTMDAFHLEALSCVQHSRMYLIDLNQALNERTRWFDFGKFGETDAGKHVIKLWNIGMNRLTLTSIGQIVGASVSDLLVG